MFINFIHDQSVIFDQEYNELTIIKFMKFLQ
jgi:hypothetical protein